MNEGKVKKEKITTEIDSILKSLPVLDEAIYEYEGKASNPKEVAELIAKVREAVDWLKLLDSTLAQEMKRITPKDKKLVEIEGGTAEIRTGAPRKQWDHERLTSLISEQIIAECIDDESGMFDRPFSQIPQLLFRFAHVDYWRAGELKNVGIDPDDYCEKGEPTTNVIIRKSGGKYGTNT